MIYRILTEDRETRWDETKHAPITVLSGASGALSDLMGLLHLPAPRITNSRTRFSFTERGWRQIGRALALRVIRRKNPAPSQIVYRDALQLAILPEKHRR